MYDQQFREWARKHYGLTELSDQKQWREAQEHYQISKTITHTH